MLALLILKCLASEPCDVLHAEVVYQGEFMPLDRCQREALLILKALPKLPDGEKYEAACVGRTYIDRMKPL